ncbi:MAG: tyrosine-type recombinase/integrase [Akkermansia sp.]|nr:tyrosine-type recombinase/integrase [Akkermansia sp.]
MKTTIADTLLKGLPVGAGDAARLILETIEELGERASGLGKVELMRLLRKVLHTGVEGVKAAEQTVSFESALWASVAARAGRRATTRRDLRHFARRMLRVEGVAQLPLRGMVAVDCRRILQEAFGGSVHSYRKGRAILHSVFAYGLRQGWCAVNPVDAVEAPVAQEKEIVPLAVAEVERLEAAARSPEHADMRLSLHLMTYCGLRPSEVSRLRPEDISFATQEVVVRPLVSKTGGGRVVPLRCTGKLRGVSCIIPRNWSNRWRGLRRAAGFSHWQADVLRHTFATYHLLHFRNPGELQLEMGHSDGNLLRTRYTNVPRAARKDGTRFWGVAERV